MYIHTCACPPHRTASRGAQPGPKLFAHAPKHKTLPLQHDPATELFARHGNTSLTTTTTTKTKPKKLPKNKHTKALWVRVWGTDNNIGSGNTTNT